MLGRAHWVEERRENLNEILDLIQWSIEDQCFQYTDFGNCRPFISAGESVFYIECPLSTGIKCRERRHEAFAMHVWRCIKKRILDDECEESGSVTGLRDAEDDHNEDMHEIYE